MSERAGKRWVHWLVPAATIVLLAIFARSVDWSRAWTAIIHADLTLLTVATLANLLSLIVKGVRWWIFLDAVGVRGVWEAVQATLAGAALNNVLVANGGDAARVAAVARRARISSAPVLATLAIDRLCDLITYAMLFAVAAFTLPLPAALARWRIPGLVMLALIGALAWALMRQSSAAPTAVTDEPVVRHVSMLDRARDYWRNLVATSSAVATRRRLTIAIGLALIAWAGQWATFHYAAHAAAFSTTPATSLLALLAVNASFLVRLTPGNVGVFQLLYALAATSTGLDKDSAVAVAFLIQLIQYIPVTVVGLLFAPSLAAPRRGADVREINADRFERDQELRIRGERQRGA